MTEMAASTLAAAAPSPNLPTAFDSRLAYVLLLVALALVSGRLLGIRVSWARGLAAAFLGFIAGFAFYYSQTVQTGTTPDFVLDFGIPALVATMLVLAILEVSYRPGAIATVPTGVAKLPRPAKAARRYLRYGARYTQVLWVVARNGLNPYLRGRAGLPGPGGDRSALAARFKRTLEECGGVFVKLGQVLSTRPDMLPQTFIATLSELQDAAPPVAYASLEPLLTSQLGAPPDEVFGEFDRHPVAAASIAQVHRARLKSGEIVVVKVARPGIGELVQRDLEIIQGLAHALAQRVAWAQHAGVVDLADGFATAIWEETDFRIEAANIEAVSAAGGNDVRIPRIFRELSTAQVLVMEWLDGVKIRDSKNLLDSIGVDRSDIARRLLRSLLRQIMVEGVFHADPHPGNVLIMRDGTPALIDFGSVGRLDAAQQAAMRRMLLGVDRRDAVLMRDALAELAGVRDTRTQDRLERALSQMLATRLGPGMRPGAELFADVMRMLVDFELGLPPHVAAVFRCLVTVEGTLGLLAPDFRVIDESRAAAADLLRDNVTVASLKQAARDELVSQLPIVRRLPRHLDQLAAAMEDGRLAIRVSLFDTASERQFLATLVGRSIYAFLGAAIAIASVMLLSAPGGPLLTPELSLPHGVGYAGLLVGAVLTLRVIVGVARDRAA